MLVTIIFDKKCEDLRGSELTTYMLVISYGEFSHYVVQVKSYNVLGLMETMLQGASNIFIVQDFDREQYVWRVPRKYKMVEYGKYLLGDEKRESV